MISRVSSNPYYSVTIWLRFLESTWGRCSDENGTTQRLCFKNYQENNTKSCFSSLHPPEHPMWWFVMRIYFASCGYWHNFSSAFTQMPILINNGQNYIFKSSEISRKIVLRTWEQIYNTFYTFALQFSFASNYTHHYCKRKQSFNRINLKRKIIASHALELKVKRKENGGPACNIMFCDLQISMSISFPKSFEIVLFFFLMWAVFCYISVHTAIW